MRTRGLNVVLVSLIVLSGCDRSPQSVTTTIEQKSKSAENPEANCIARPVIDKMRDQVFDAAVSKVEDKEAIKLNSLRSAIVGRIENPVVVNHDPAVARTECSGRIVFGLPPNTQKAFNGATQIFADISYAAQPAADKSGLVVSATGTDTLVDSLVQGAQLKRSATAGPLPSPRIERIFDAGPPPPLPSSMREFGDSIDQPSGIADGPSFRCSGKLNRVERMICDDPGLASMDRNMVDAYQDARDRTPSDARARLEAIRLKYLSRRNQCADAACIATTYDGWTAAMYDWNP